MYASTTINISLLCSLFSKATGNEVEGLLLVVEGGLGVTHRCRGNKVKSRLGIVDRCGTRGWTNKVKSSLGIVLWGWSRSWANKVQGRLGIVDWGGSNRGGNECKLSILVCLPFRRSLNLNLPLATTSSGSNNSLLLSKPIQLFLGIVPTSSSKRTDGWGNMGEFCVLICLPFRGANHLNLSLATTSSGSNNCTLLSNIVQLLLMPVPASTSKRSN